MSNFASSSTSTNKKARPNPPSSSSSSGSTGKKHPDDLEEDDAGSSENDYDEADEDEDDDGEDDSEDGEDDIEKLPRMFYEYALEQLENTDEVFGSAEYAKIVGSLKKSRELLLASNADLKTLLEKASKRKAGDTKVPPGSALVQRNINDKRFLLCLINILLSKIHHLLFEQVLCVAALKEALVWFPRSIEANYLMGEQLRGYAGDVRVLNQCEAFYIKAEETGSQLSNSKSSSSSSSASLSTKKEDQADSKMNEIIRADELCAHKKAVQSLILYYLQSGRNNDAYKYLVKYGYKLKLSSQVLQYHITGAATNHNHPLSLAAPSDTTHSTFLSAIDEAVPSAVLSHLRSVFRPAAPFWSEHHYDTLCNASKTAGYFSYLYPMRERAAVCSIEQVIDRLYPLVCQQFPQAREATLAEWWVHSRPHINGHQLHFDSDETRIQTGAGKVQHPIVSCVLFVTAGVGGPTVVTNQRITGALATQGWLAEPKTNRLVTFDANYLHGVIPGRDINPSCSPDAPTNNKEESRRLTFMVGFWRSIAAKNRGKDTPGPGQPFPDVRETKYTWPAEMSLRSELSVSSSSESNGSTSGVSELKRVQPIELSSIWEDIEVGVDAAVIAQVNPTAATAAAAAAAATVCSRNGGDSGRESASYKECFQGF